MDKLKTRNILIIIGISLFLIVCFVLFLPRFHVKKFSTTLEIPYNGEFLGDAGVVCYGNVFSCEIITGLFDEIDTGTIGEKSVIYHYTYGKKTYEKEQKIIVIDNEAPKIQVTDADFVYCPNGSVPAYEAQAIDNYDGDISDKIERYIENEELVFSVTDSSLNTSVIRKKARIEDKVPPVITLNKGEYEYVKKGDEYHDPGAEAYDSCDGDLSSKIEIQGSVDTSKEKEYLLTYSVTDTSGNKATKTRHVIVGNFKESTSKKVYLTFDDGPGPYTAKLLDVLKKYDVKATFFVTHQNLTRSYDNVLLRAYQEGHTIGLHSYSHDYNIYSNEKTYFDDLYAIQEKVKEITGYTSNIIRFPGGSSNMISTYYDDGKKIMSFLAEEVKKKGFSYYDWNVVSGDAGETTDTAVVIANVIKGISTKNEAIVLQHDIKEFSVNAVENIIQYGLTNGYTFLPITKDTTEIHHHINN